MYFPLSRRSFLARSGGALLSASALGSLLAACGSSASSANTIALWMGVDDGNQRTYIQKSDVQGYMDSHKDIKINLSFKPVSDIDRLIQVALPSGKGPDIVPTPGPSYALQYIDSKLLLDLDQYAQQKNWKDKIFPWALDAGRLNGKLYSIPSSYETMLLYYNKTLFDQHGWKPPTTRSELEGMAEEMMGQKITPFIGGSADWRATTEWFVTFFWNHYSGPDALYQALTGKLAWTDPVFVDAITLMKQYFDKGWFGGGVKPYFTNTSDAQDSAMAKGTIAMDIEGSWAFSNWPNFFGGSNSNTDYGWAPLPALRNEVPKNLYPLGIGGTYSISTKSKSVDAAVEYLDWLYSTPKRVTAEMAAINYEPLPIPLRSSDFPSNVDPRLRDAYLALDDAAAKGNFGYTTWTFWPPQTDVFVYEGMDKVLTGSLTPAQYCAQIDSTFKKEFAQGAVPPIPKGQI